MCSIPNVALTKPKKMLKIRITFHNLKNNKKLTQWALARLWLNHSFTFLGMIGKLIWEVQDEGIHASSTIAIITHKTLVDVLKN